MLPLGNYGHITDRSANWRFPDQGVYEWYSVENQNRVTKGKEPPGQICMYIPPGDERDETYRLATFSRFPITPISIFDLARAGFLYTGYADRVKCFSCGVNVEGWKTNESPFDYVWHDIDCRMAQGRDDRNLESDSTRVHCMLQQYSGIYRGQVSYTVGASNNDCHYRGRSPVLFGIQLETYERNTVRDANDATRDLVDQDDTNVAPPLSHCGQSTGISVTGHMQEPHAHLESDDINHLSSSRDWDLYLCKECKRRTREVVFLPCGHLCICKSCALNVFNCTICKLRITEKIVIERIEG